jgi:hypothetical protein
VPSAELMNGAYFCVRWKTTVFASGASTDFRLSPTEEQVSGLPRQFFDRCRSKLNFTSAEVISLPSWNRMPFLSLTVHVSPSVEVSGAASAAHGMYSSL